MYDSGLIAVQRISLFKLHGAVEAAPLFHLELTQASHFASEVRMTVQVVESHVRRSDPCHTKFDMSVWA